MTPGWGDAIQANKAGLLELADVFVVNKADRRARAMPARDLEYMLDLGHISGLEERSGHRPAVLMATSTTGEGVDGVLAAIDDHRALISANGELAERRRRRRRLEVSARVGRLLEARTAEVLDSEAGEATLSAVDEDRLSPAEAARAVLAEIACRI